MKLFRLNTHKKLLWIAVLFGFMSFIGTILNGAAASAESIAVIVNKSNSEAIDMAKLGQIFQKDYRIWVSGKDIVPIDLKDGSDTHSRFLDKVLGKNESQIKSYWIQQKITKNLKEPLSFKNAAKVKSFVGKIGNAIGYIPKSAVDDSVKVVLEIN